MIFANVKFCDICKKSRKGDEKVQLDTAEGKLEMHLCKECADVLDYVRGKIAK